MIKRIKETLLFINKIIFLAISCYILTEYSYYKTIFIQFSDSVKIIPVLESFFNFIENLNSFILLGPMCIVILSLRYPESKILNMIANFFALSCSLITTVIMIQKGIWLDSINLGLFKIYNKMTFEEKRKLFEFYLSQIGPTYPPEFFPFIREKINSTFETKIMYNLSSLERSGIEPYVSKLLNEWWIEYKNIKDSTSTSISSSWGTFAANVAAITVISGSIALIGYTIYKWFFTNQVNNNIMDISNKSLHDAASRKAEKFMDLETNISMEFLAWGKRINDRKENNTDVVLPKESKESEVLSPNSPNSLPDGPTKKDRYDLMLEKVAELRENHAKIRSQLSGEEEEKALVENKKEIKEIKEDKIKEEDNKRDSLDDDDIKELDDIIEKTSKKFTMDSIPTAAQPVYIPKSEAVKRFNEFVHLQFLPSVEKMAEKTGITLEKTEEMNKEFDSINKRLDDFISSANAGKWAKNALMGMALIAMGYAIIKNGSIPSYIGSMLGFGHSGGDPHKDVNVNITVNSPNPAAPGSYNTPNVNPYKDIQMPQSKGDSNIAQHIADFIQDISDTLGVPKHWVTVGGILLFILIKKR